MKLILRNIFVGIIFLTVSCNTVKYTVKKNYRQLSSAEKALVDSMLSYALDHEALYTLLDTIKPISSVKFLHYPIANYHGVKGKTDVVKETKLLLPAESYQKICSLLSNKYFQFVVSPFQRIDSLNRNIEIYITRKSSFSKKINEHQSFFGQWGFTASSNPATVLSVIEYENKYDRYRGYGYLFGYPKHAVDFFTEAASAEDSTKQFVKRNFFAIPVYAAEKGHFTYAVPKDYEISITDSAIYKNAIATLNNYKKARNKFIKNGNFSAFKLWMKKFNK